MKKNPIKREDDENNILAEYDGYYLNNEMIAKHIDVPLSKKKTDGPYGPSKPYIKIGIYRIGETGTTSFAYNNLVIKNKKKWKNF